MRDLVVNVVHRDAFILVVLRRRRRCRCYDFGVTCCRFAFTVQRGSSVIYANYSHY